MKPLHCVDSVKIFDFFVGRKKVGALIEAKKQPNYI